MSSIEKIDRSSKSATLEVVLRAIDATGEVPDSIIDAPGTFIRNMYEAWVEDGGKVSARYNRNSLTKMGEWLAGKSAVKSLHQKLSGHVRMTRFDVTSLLHLFLDRWHFDIPVDAQKSDQGTYLPFDTEDKSQLIRTISNSIFANSQNKDGILLPNTTLMSIPSDEIESAIEFSRHIPNSAVTIAISRQKTILGHNIYWTMRSFWHLFHGFFDRRNDTDQNNFMQIWIIDVGSRIVEDSASFPNYYNAGFLAMSFLSLANFESCGNDTQVSSIYRAMGLSNKEKKREFWHWFRERCIVIVQNLKKDDFYDYLDDNNKELRKLTFGNIGITPEQILPSTIPGKWAKKLRDLYGKDTDSLNAATIVVQIDQNEKDVNEEMVIKYNAYTNLNIDKEEQTTEKMYRNVELPSPGQNYDGGMKMAYRAARYILHDEYKKISITEEDKISYAYLTSIGFEPMALRNFIQIFWSSIDLLED